MTSLGAAPAAPMKSPKAIGVVPTATVATTESLEVSMTDTSSMPLLATYARVPARLTAMPMGSAPTGIVVSTVLVEVSTTVTSSLRMFA